MGDAIVADRNINISHEVDNSRDGRPPTTVDKDEEFEEMLTEQLAVAVHRRQPIRVRQTAETTQIVITTVAPVKRFNGTQFLHTPYLGEHAVLQPVWVVPETAASSVPAVAKTIGEAAFDEPTEKFQESKSNESVPAAQHLPPGANCQIAEKKPKSKKKGKGEGKKSSKSDDSDDSKSDGGGGKGGDDRKRDDSDDDEPRRRGYK
jgi:hypothetical protein